MSGGFLNFNHWQLLELADDIEHEAKEYPEFAEEELLKLVRDIKSVQGRIRLADKLFSDDISANSFFESASVIRIGEIK